MDLSQKKSDLKFVENEKDMTKIIGSIDKENKQEVGITFHHDSREFSNKENNSNL